MMKIYKTGEIQDYRKGIGISSISGKSLSSIQLPLAPIKEQQRIIDRIEELFSLCKQLEEQQTANLTTHHYLVKSLLETLTNAADADELQLAWGKLSEHFDTLFCTEDSIKQLKQTILQLAIMGRLVKQDPKDEPIDELLKRIESGKQKNGAKTKKSRISEEFSFENIGIELPKGWQWVRLGEISEIKGGKRLPAGHLFSPTETPFIYIQVTNMKNGTIIQNDLKYISKETQAEIARYIINKEDLYITIAGTIGDVGIVPEFFDGMNLTENAAKIVFSNINKYWLQKVLSSQILQNQFIEKTNQLAQPKLALHRVESSFIPICPIQEQERIVKKLEEINSILDILKERINKSAELKQSLSKTVVEII